jgi:hypothetical protein
MSFSKTIPIGSAGALTISESGGVGAVALSLSEASGGSLKDVVKGSVNVSINLSGIILLQAASAVLSSQFPAEAALISGLESIIQSAVTTL